MAKSLPDELATPDPQIIDAGDDLTADFFFEENKGKIAALFVVALLGLCGWLFYHFQETKARSEQSAAFYGAKTPDEWKSVIAKYPGTIVAGNARLLLAAKLRDEQKLDEALAVLTEFTKNTTHPLIAQGWLSYAATLELKGDLEPATKAYANIAVLYGSSEAAPAALAGEARLVKTAGDLKKARSIYENIVQRFPTSIWSQEAQQELAKLPE